MTKKNILIINSDVNDYVSTISIYEYNNYVDTGYKILYNHTIIIFIIQYQYSNPQCN